MHKAWCGLGEVPYCFSRSIVKVQGHTAKEIIDLDPSWMEMLNSGQNCWFFVLCDLKIWRTTLKNNRAPLLYYAHYCPFQPGGGIHADHWSTISHINCGAVYIIISCVTTIYWEYDHMTAWPQSGKKSGKFQSDQKSWKSHGILKWVKEFLKFMETWKVRELYICHCGPWKFESGYKIEGGWYFDFFYCSWLNSIFD